MTPTPSHEHRPLHLAAEVGVNHEGDLERAKRMVMSARSAGATSVKFQYYRADSLASQRAGAYWDMSAEATPDQHSLFSKYDTFGPSDFRILADLAHELGMQFALSVFHVEAVQEVVGFSDYLKIASGDITFRQLIAEATCTKLPIVISTGASTIREISDAVAWFTHAGGSLDDLTLLQCTLAYPTQIRDANVGSLRVLQKAFPEVSVGISDHIPDASPTRFIAARALGAEFFEKHFTDDNSADGNDHYHAFTELEFSRMETAIRECDVVYGSEELVLPVEAAARGGARRSLFASRRLQAGVPLKPSDMIALRPAAGISPAEFDLAVGRIPTRPVEAGEMLTWDLLGGR